MRINSREMKRQDPRRKIIAQQPSPAGHGAQGADRRRRSPDQFEPQHQNPPLSPGQPRPQKPDRFDRNLRQDPRRRSPDLFEPKRSPQPPKRDTRPLLRSPQRHSPKDVAAQPKLRPSTQPQPSPVQPRHPRPAPSAPQPSPKQFPGLRRVPTHPPSPSAATRPPSPARPLPPERLGSKMERPLPPTASALRSPRSPRDKLAKDAPPARVERHPSVAPSFRSTSGGSTSRQQSTNVSASTGRTFRDRPRRERFGNNFIFLVKKHPRKFLVGVVVSLIIIAVISTVLVVALRRRAYPFTNSGRVFHDHCRKHDIAKVVDAGKCIVGAAPTADSCRAKGFCKASLFKVGRKGKRTEFEDQSLVYGNSTSVHAGAFCRLDDGGKSRLGVCSKNGRCDHIFNGTDDQTRYRSGEWVDNCDQPNPCWKGVTPELFEQKQGKFWTDRARCTWAGPGALYMIVNPGMDAEVWLMHTRCKVGKNQTASRPCAGLPIKLLRCRFLAYPRKPLNVELCEETPSRFKRDGCLFTCTGGTPDVHMPNGARCNLTGVELDETQEAYCFNGMCLIATPIEEALPVATAGECLSKRKAEEGW